MENKISENNSDCEKTNVSETAVAFDNFFNVIKRLRAPDGCPWDKEQTPVSLRSTLIEETFEAVDAISSNDSIHAKEELGDVMLNAIMIAYMYEQSKDFSVADSFNEISKKLIRRHPHVFKESEGRSLLQNNLNTSEQVLSQWDAIKQKIEGREKKSILDEVPEGFPPLLKAYKLQKKASKKGFDWPEGAESQVFPKIVEELDEVKNAVTAFDKTKNDGNKKQIEDELGDVLFSVVNFARHLGIDPSVALSRSNSKFYRRFSYVEKQMAEKNIDMSKENLCVMDDFWNEAKSLEK